MFHLECPGCKRHHEVNSRLHECPGWRFTCACGCRLLLVAHQLICEGEKIAQWFYFMEESDDADI